MTIRIGEPASRCLSEPVAGASRFVGDPVDIVTGAVVDQETDFRLPRAALALSWVRRFDSRELSRDRGLGRGFRHGLDRELRFDLDGITYVDGAWERTTFPHLEHDRQRSTQIGCALERVDDKHYRIQDSDGRSYEFTFASPDEPARLDRILDADGTLSLYYERQQLYAIGLGMLGRLRIAWADGRISSIALQETEPERETLLVSYRYDERGCLIEAKNAYKHSLRYDFDAELRLAKKTDRRGYAFHFAYDTEGRCVESRGDDGAEAVKLEYRPIERTTLVTRHDGGTWRYQYNDSGSISNILDPYQGMQSYLFDRRGRVTEELDPLGNSSRFRFSTLGLAEEKVDVFGLSSDPAAPHPHEHRVAQTPLELEWGTLFDAPARLPVTGNPLWEFPTHARALIQTAEPEWGGHTHLERSLQGLPVRELREDGKMRHWTFDENANVRKQVDFDGHARTFEYVSDNHVSVERDALGRIIRYEHSPTENLTALTDSGGTRSQFVLDLKDRVSEVHRNGKLRERYAYDVADNLVEKHDGSGQLLFEQTIGAGNRKTARKLGSGEIQTFAYDQRGA
jgi:YD repeat-containing protein